MTVCSIPKCGRNTIGRGFCSTHYSRWFRNGNQTLRRDLTLTLEQRFWAKVQKRDQCWLWTGAASRQGYGQLLFKRKNEKAHRLSWQLHNGAIPEGVWVLHKCDVKKCVRPDHLFLGTRLDNVRDMIAKGRDARGERSATAKLTEGKVREIISIGSSLSRAEIGRRFGVHSTTVSWILRGHGWKHIPRR